MTWLELWQTMVANLRALFSRRDAAFSPPLPQETAAPADGAPDIDSPDYPVFPTIWDDPAPEPEPTPRRRAEPISTLPEPPAADSPMIAEARQEPHQEPARPAPANRTVDADVDATAEASELRAVEPDAPGMEVDDREVDDREVEDGRAAPAQTEPALPDQPALSVVLESVLFVASEPVTPAQLARSLQVSEAEIQAGLAALVDHYRSSGRGLQLQQLHGKVQLVTAPAVATYVEAFLNLDATARLSGPALETLAVVAYRQPVTRAQVEAIRGVDCAGVLRSLVQRGLIAEVGRLESVGRPILYGVTELFMQHFGLADLKDLPPLEENEADRLWAATLLAEPDSDMPGAAPSDSQATEESSG